MRSWYLVGLLILLTPVLSRAVADRDGLSSPSGTRVAYVEGKETEDSFNAEITITDRTGKVQRRIMLDDPLPGCNAITSTKWVDENRLGVECHINPSNGGYIVLDAGAGKVLDTFVGSNFAWSPDGKHMANNGSVGHFGEHSDSLEIDGKQVFPLESDAQDDAVHAFGQWRWATDSKKVALVDLVLPEGRLSVVVADIRGRSLVWNAPFPEGTSAAPVMDEDEHEDREQALYLARDGFAFSWEGPTTLRVFNGDLNWSIPLRLHRKTSTRK